RGGLFPGLVLRDAEAEAGRAEAVAGRCAGGGALAPAGTAIVAAAHDMPLAAVLLARRAIRRGARIVGEQAVRRHLPDIAGHVVEPPGIGGEAPDRRDIVPAIRALHA